MPDRMPWWQRVGELVPPAVHYVKHDDGTSSITVRFWPIFVDAALMLVAVAVVLVLAGLVGRVWEWAL